MVRHGRTGFLAKDVDSAVNALRRTPELERRNCREWVEERFSAHRMVFEYLGVYEQAMQRAREAASALEEAETTSAEVACG